MSETSGDVILLAADEAVQRSVLTAIPDAVVYRAPLEAVADLAAGQARTLVTTPADLGYRTKEILGAVRRACPDTRVYLVCRPEEEPQAMRTAGVTDYFPLPFALGDLARAVGAGSRPAERPSHAPLKEPPTLDDVLDGRLRDRLRATVHECLQNVARLSRRAAPEIAQETVNAFASLPEVAAAVVLDGNGDPVPLAASEPVPDWSAVVELVSGEPLPSRCWLQVDDETWLFAAGGTEGPGPVLALRSRGRAVTHEFLEELATAAGISLALIVASQVRQAALKIIATDPETGVASRRYFDQYLSALCRQAGELRREVALVLVSPGGHRLLARTALPTLVELMERDFPSAKLARVDDQTLGAVLVGPAGDRAAVAKVEAFAGRVQSIALPVPTAVSAASFPWHATDASSLLAAAKERLAKSRNTGKPVVE